jgi:uncharacterized protein (TIGR03435 family)
MIMAPAWFSQTSTPSRAFAVASVKLNTSGYNAAGNKFGPDTMRWTNVPLKDLLQETYRLKNYQVLNAPPWTETDRWDIDAKCAGPATSQEQFEMLGTLLAERFQLRFHRETRQLPILRLEIAKNGPKLATAHPQDSDHKWGTLVDRGLLDMHGADMRNFLYWLSSQLNQPIVDQTGLTGIYDLKLEWAPDDASSDDSRLSIFAAVDSELGLKLVAAKGPVDVLVVEHVERATGN